MIIKMILSFYFLFKFILENCKKSKSWPAALVSQLAITTLSFPNKTKSSYFFILNMTFLSTLEFYCVQ